MELLVGEITVNHVETSALSDQWGDPIADTASLRMQRYLFALGYSEPEVAGLAHSVNESLSSESLEPEQYLPAAMQKLRRILDEAKDGSSSKVSVTLPVAYSFQRQRACTNRAWSMPPSRRTAMAPKDYEPRFVKRLRALFNPARTWT